MAATRDRHATDKGLFSSGGRGGGEDGKAFTGFDVLGPWRRQLCCCVSRLTLRVGEFGERVQVASGWCSRSSCLTGPPLPAFPGLRVPS